jgi:hypothetical protein
MISAEHTRMLLSNPDRASWYKWGPYLSDRQWGTVREDYSPYGSAWEYTTHDMARSKSYRWGEEGIGGISDENQLLCFGISLWNKKDPILKERYFGLGGNEGNHGEDVKECYYYLDNVPSHSYMKMLYKYPQREFPYALLLNENKRRTTHDPEFELIDTGIFDDDGYFDVFIEYAKSAPEDILVKISVFNRGNEAASMHVVPTCWFRNIWSWGQSKYPFGSFKEKPMMEATHGGIHATHETAGDFYIAFTNQPSLLFCENDTNIQRLYNTGNDGAFYKDGINDFIIHRNENAVNPALKGTKVAANYELTVEAKKSATIGIRITRNGFHSDPFGDFENIFSMRKAEADEYYGLLQNNIESADARLIQRQAFAGMLWSKQYYYYDVEQWLNGDPAQPVPPAERLKGRNHEWRHLNNADIISMPDTWEFPWYASWDLAFHAVTFASIDAAFAKHQLVLLTRDWYLHPNGALPAYECSFSDVNPPVHAWASWRVYRIDQDNNNGKGDNEFLESVFHKLLLNFTWWVNRKDSEGNNLFEGGFLGLDNIGVFNRNETLPSGASLEQSDGTSWMAMYSLNMMRIALELAKRNATYQNLGTTFFEHFLYIAGAIFKRDGKGDGLWDEADQFYYDELQLADGSKFSLKLRSLVSLIPLFAVEVLDDEIFLQQKEFVNRLNWFFENRPDLASLVSRWNEKRTGEMHLLSLLRGHRLKMILVRMLDESEFLSPYGIRSLSKYHEEHPYDFYLDQVKFTVHYTPAESDTGIFGGNSNWRGPVWMPVNYLVLESLRRFHQYYGDDFKVEYPSRSGKFFSLAEVTVELGKRLAAIFLRNEEGRRPVFGNYTKFQTDPHFRDYILFHEYFHGDDGHGLGASHQTGWTGLIANLWLNTSIEHSRIL